MMTRLPVAPETKKTTMSLASPWHNVVLAVAIMLHESRELSVLRSLLMVTGCAMMAGMLSGRGC